MARFLIVPVLLVLGWLVAWLDGRSLVREPCSAAFPERWRGHVARLVGLGGLLTAGMVVDVSPHMWSLGLVLTTGTLVAAHYPVRRAAYGESWRFVRYAVTALRQGAAFVAFWILLAVTPQLIVAVPHQPWIAASSLAALLLSGLRYRRELFLFLVGARPFRPAPQAFARVLARADGTVPVTAYRAGVPGGLCATSFALPCPGGHAIVIGDSLIEILDPDALTAVFALEVARLECWTPRRMHWVEALKTALVVVAVVGGLGARQLLGDNAPLVAAMWGVALLLAFALWTIARRGDERVTDIGAATLCSDASALIRALSVVHSLRRIPRRLAPFSEEMSTGPSLARRLRDLRQAAGIAPTTLVAPVVLSSPDLDRVVILDAGRAQWLEGVSAGVTRDSEAVRLSAGSIRSVAYRDLIDLRLVTDFSGATWLKATHRSGRSWRAPIRRQDVAAAQAALDVVDERLAATGTVTRRRATLMVVFATAAAASAWAQVGVSHVIILAAIVIARRRESPSWLVSLLILSWALQDTAAPRNAIPSFVRTLTVATMAIGAVAFVIGPAARRRAALRPSLRETGVAAGTLVAAAVLLGLDVLWVARAATASIPYWRVDDVALSLIAAAGAVAFGRWWRGWITATAIGTLGVAIFRWGPAVLVAWAPLASGTPVAVHDVPAPTSRVVVLEPSARRLVLSPSASQFGVQVGRSRASMPDHFVLGTSGGERLLTSAYDLSFLDDSTALVVGPTTNGRELRTLPLGPSGVDRPGWSIPLPAVYAPRVSADASTGIWTVVGWHPEDGDAISVAGRVGDDVPDVKRWIIPGADANASFFYLPATKTAFSVTRATLSHGPALLSRLAGVHGDRWELWKLDGKTGATLAVTAAALVCLDPLPRDDALLCLARHAEHTVIWSVDGRSGRLSEFGRVSPFRLARLSSGYVRMVMADRSILQIPRGGRQVKRFAPPTAGGDIAEMYTTEDHLAMLMRFGADVRLLLHETR